MQGPGYIGNMVLLIAPLRFLRCFGCDTEQREPDGGYEDTAVLRPFYDVLLCGLRRYRAVQRGQAHDGRGLQQHLAHARHGRVCVALRTGALNNNSRSSSSTSTTINRTNMILEPSKSTSSRNNLLCRNLDGIR